MRKHASLLLGFVACAACGGRVDDTSLSTPVEAIASDVVQIAAGWNRSCALYRDGTVACWGVNDTLGLGVPASAVGSCTYTYPGSTRTTQISCARTPTRVPLGAPVKAIAAADNYACALLADTTVTCWGTNEFGQLGTGITQPACDSLNGTRSHVPCSGPVAIEGISGATAISTSRTQACALKSDGSVMCWGGVDYESLYTPVPLSTVPGPNGFVALATSAPCAIRADGSATCWTVRDLAFSPMDAPVSDVAAMVGYFDTCARTTQGLVECWGQSDENRELGVDNVVLGSVVYVTLPEPSAALFAGDARVCSLAQSGALYCWGAAGAGMPPIEDAALRKCVHGKLGSGPCYAPGRAAIEGVSILAMGASHSCALRSNGSVSCWGDNALGALGSDQSH